MATPVAWDEVTAKLDPAKFTLRSVPERLGKLRSDPWEGFAALRQRLPDLANQQAAPAQAPRKKKSAIVSAGKPKRRAQL